VGLMVRWDWAHAQEKTEKHVAEVTHLHHAVEPSTAWQDGLERATDMPTPLALARGSGAAGTHNVLERAAQVLNWARSDLSHWKEANPQVGDSKS